MEDKKKVYTFLDDYADDLIEHKPDSFFLHLMELARRFIETEKLDLNEHDVVLDYLKDEKGFE